MLIDLHTHTKPLSWDSKLTADELIELSRERGLDGICLSEHDYFWKPDEVALLAKRHNYLVLPAVEIGTNEGHMLCYGLPKYVYGMHEWSTLKRELDTAGAVAVAPHPYRRHMPRDVHNVQKYEEALRQSAGNRAYPGCVALETINGRGTTDENGFSSRLCDLLQMHATAGTDSHNVDDVGVCATEFERRITSIEELIVELASGRFQPVQLRLNHSPLSTRA